MTAFIPMKPRTRTAPGDDGHSRVTDHLAAAVVALTELTLEGRRTGAFFDVRSETRALEQAYDPRVQQRLRHEAEASIAPFARGLATGR